MKKSWMNNLSSLIFLCAVGMLSTAVWAQDPAKVDSEHYKVEFENDEVRVLRIHYKPGEASVMHEHPKGVVVFLSDMDTEFKLENGEKVSVKAESGKVIWTDKAKHEPKNLSDSDLKVIQIELKSNSENTQRFTTKSSLIAKSKALIKSYEDQDWAEWQKQYADTAKLFHNSWEKSMTPKEFMELQKDYIMNFSSYQFIEEPRYFEQVIDDQGRHWVYFWGVWEGDLKDGGGDIIKIPVHLAFYFENDKIVQEYGFYDLSTYFDSMKEKKF